MYIDTITLRPEGFPVRDCYPFHLPFLHLTPRLELSSPVTFFIGENGSGKSTLLRAIARRCGMHIWEEPNRRRMRYNRYEDELYRHIDIAPDFKSGAGSFFGSEIFNHFARILDEWAASDPGVLGYFGDESLMTKSHGQCHMAYFQNRFKIEGLYLLDEPETALSPRRQIELLGILKQVIAAADVQFIIATHSPILLAFPGAEIYSFDSAPLGKIRYEDTDYYTIYKSFLNDRERWLGGI